MDIVDAHHHLWNTRLIDIPWLMGSHASFGDPAALRVPYRPADYKRDLGGVNVLATVHLCTEAVPAHAVHETMWLTGVHDGSGLPTALIGWADPEAADFETLLDTHARSPLLRGIRYRLNYDEPSGRRIARSADMMERDTFRRGLRLLGRRNLAFELSVFAPQLEQAAELATAVPEVTFVLNQLGWPIASDREAFEQWRRGMAVIAKQDNVVAKIAGFWSIDREWQKDKIGPWVKEGYALFGPERCLYGTALPIEKLFCAVPRQIELLTSILASESGSAIEQVFKSTAARVYRLNLN
jgi:predicted TIM-barrel fold metal-dependent hydrolase